MEAQESDPSSLLHWMRNMIRLRKQFTVFGRGYDGVARAGERQVLAYVRRYKDDIVLCVANLSRSVQPAELDLSAFAGLVPVEMLGYTEFPAITRGPVLPDAGAVWLLLVRAPACRILTPRPIAPRSSSR